MIGGLVMQNLRLLGLETPLLQRRLIDAWPEVAGQTIARYTTALRIQTQPLCVSLSSPALRADLSMCRQQLVERLNAHVGAQVICDIRFH